MYLWVGVSIRPKHGWDRLSTCLGHRDARDTLNNTGLFHERRVELGGNAAYDCTVIAWKTRARWVGGSGTPEMVGCVGQKVDFRFIKEGRLATVSLRKNDFVEQLNGRVVSPFTLAFMYEFIEACTVLANQVTR